MNWNNAIIQKSQTFFFFTVESRHGETYRGSDTTQKNVQHPVFIKGLQMTAFCFYALFSVSCFFFELGLYVWLALLSYYGWDWNIIHSLCILITFMVSWILCGPLIGELASQAKHCFLNNGIKSKVVHVNISASLNWQHRCKTEPVQSPPAFIPAPVKPQIRWMWLFVRTVEPLVILLSYMYNALVLS